MPRKTTKKTDSLGRVRPTTRSSFGTVRQLPSGRWQASYVGTDEQRYKAPHTFDTKGDAAAWLAPHRQAVKNGTWKAPAVVSAETLGVYAPSWVAARRRRDGGPLALSTQEQYRNVVARGLAPLHTTRLADITPAVVRRWHATRSADTGATRAGLEARILRAILNTAKADGLIPGNPVPSELTVTKTGREHRPPTDAELSVILDRIEPRFRLAVQLAAFGGLRIGEWRALTRADLTRVETETEARYVVNVERPAGRVDGAWVVSPPKSEDGTRTITLASWLTPYVDSHLSGQKAKFGAALLFPSGGDGEYVDQAWRRAWDAARVAAGVRYRGEDKKWVQVVREHDLRHYYGTRLAQAGASSLQLKSAMGHASIQSSMPYIHSQRGASPEVADLLKAPTAATSNVVPIRAAQ